MLHYTKYLLLLAVSYVSGPHVHQAPGIRFHPRFYEICAFSRSKPGKSVTFFIADPLAF